MTPLTGIVRTRWQSPTSKEKVAVIGGGIVGLAHAWAAARHGAEVTLFERHPQAIGASIRNFGMVWPIGQANGPRHRAALRSRERWLELAGEVGFWHDPCGSLHLAHREDELAVLAEFCDLAPSLGYECQLLTSAETLRRSPAVNPEGLLGAMWSGTEICVDPREVIAKVPRWLHERFGVELQFATTINRVELPLVEASDGRRWEVDRVFVAGGADLQTLYPEVLDSAGFRHCKLQMLRTLPQPAGWRIGPMLASGLTLRHYPTFAVCKSLRALKQRIASETPELDRYGIHVMAAQNGRNEIVLGDSHEYSDCPTPFDRAEIDELMLRELRTLLRLPDWTISERWHGVYVKLEDEIQFVREPQEGVTIVVASGGSGMTMSFGLAEQMWSTGPWASELNGAAAAQDVAAFK